VTLPPAISTLSLHDALPIYRRKTSFPDPALRFIESIQRTMEGHRARRKVQHGIRGARISIAGLAHAAGIHKRAGGEWESRQRGRSEEHTSELQSRFDLVCRL